MGERSPAAWHRHVHLVNQRAHKARIYPPLLCCRDFARCSRATSGDRGDDEFCAVPEDPVIPREPELQEELVVYWDDSKGVFWDPKLVRQARKEEIIELHKYKV